MQTKGKAKFRGKIFGLEKDNLIDNNKEKTLKNLRIKTDYDNSHFVKVTQWKNAMKQVNLFHEDKDDDRRKKVDWSHRYSFKKDGFHPIGIKTKDKDGNKHRLLPYDFIDFLFENFENGDDVFVLAEQTFSENGNKKYINYEIDQLYPTTDEIDFEADDFEEIADFNTSLIFKDCKDYDDELVVTTIVTNWQEKPIDLDVTVDSNLDTELAEYMKNNMNYGDVFEAEGIVHNRVEFINDEDDDEEVENTGIGGRRKKSFKNSGGTQIVEKKKGLQLLYIDNITEEVYTPEEISEMGTSDDDEMVDKAKKKKKKSKSKPWE